ncbi:MAG: hypothetical protein LZ173_02090 [Thaumarchaeota archaeon]|nr:hypothetical protein [Candidatus Geocrenenecus arthurdayi]
MIVVKPKSVEELKKIVEEARKEGKFVYISAYPCAECEAFDALLEVMFSPEELSKIIKIDTPNDDDIIEYIVDGIGIKGAPSVVAPDGNIIDDFDVYELAKKLKVKMSD